jgi:GNAT superfamily N-acetyltransferase
MRLERATEQALHAGLQLLQLQFAEHKIDLEAEDLRRALRALMVDASLGAVLLAYDPEPIAIAVLSFTWTLEHGGRVAWLDELFVLHEHRGRGVGLAMLTRALEVAAQAGCRAVDLEVDAQHARAERLYEREGFRRLLRSRWSKTLAPRRGVP